MSSSSTPGGELPDWLEDVRSTEAARPPKPTTPTPTVPEPVQAAGDVPDWMEDLRIWVALDVKAKPTSPVEVLVPILVEEPPSAKTPKQAEPAIPHAEVVKPVPSAVAGQIPTALPIAKVVAAPSSPPQALPRAAPVPAPPPVSVPAPAPSVAMPAHMVEKAIKETGFDLRTGQIVDPARFESWKQQQAQGAPDQSPVTNANLMQVFRKARTTVENWLDEASNRPLILAMDRAGIRSHPFIQSFFKLYEPYGAAFRAKLLQHLEFMTENRCKYYTARPEG